LKQVVSDVSLECGRMLRAETLTSLHPRLVLRSGWRKLSSPFPVGCKVELVRAPHSFWRCCAAGGICTRGVTCSLLMNASAETSSLQLETLAS